jgi:hypothetical protein
MKRTLYFVFLLVFYSCDGFESNTQFIQLTRDDLSYLIYNNDTVLVTEKDLNFSDTIQYMYNRTSVVNAVITTTIHAYKPQQSLLDIYYVYGRTTYNFLNCPSFKSADINVSRHSEYGNSDQLFSVILNGGGWQKMIRYSEDSVTVRDSAIILGHTFQGVIMFHPSIEDNSIIKTVMFAKKTGYIKIETIDGDLLERII